MSRSMKAALQNCIADFVQKHEAFLLAQEKEHKAVQNSEEKAAELHAAGTALRAEIGDIKDVNVILPIPGQMIVIDVKKGYHDANGIYVRELYLGDL